MASKKLILAVLLFLLGFAFAETRPRMVMLGEEDIQHGSVELHAKFLHDRETGQEVVCITAFAHADGEMSCYLTGRHWNGE